MKGTRRLSNELKNNVKHDPRHQLGKQPGKTCSPRRLGLLLTAFLLWGAGSIQGMEGETASPGNKAEAGDAQGRFQGFGLMAYGEVPPSETEQEYIFPEADEQVLTEEDLKGLEETELSLGLLEIYARHGMIFADESLNEYFKEKDWYFGFIQEAEFPEELLNEFETANAEFLRKKISGGSEQEEGTEAMQVEGQEPQTERPKETEEPETDQERPKETEEPGTDQEQPKETGEPGTDQERPKETEEPEESETVQEEKPEAETMEVTASEESETAQEEKPEAETTEVAASEEAETAPEKAEPETAEPEEKEAEDLIIKIPEPETVGEENRLQDMQDVDIMGIYGAGSEQDRRGRNGNAGQSLGASEYIFPDAASRYLSRSEVEALSLQAICYAKNEIYARHGRKFLARELQEYFCAKSWYQGRVEPDAFSDKVFNDFERQNLLLIVECEQAVRPDGYQLDQPGYDISLVGTADKYTIANAQAAEANGLESSLDSRDYIFSDSDVRYLTEEEVQGLSSAMAHLAWNEIYARRGYIFEPGEMRDYFRSKSWYAEKISPQDFTADMLNKFEQYNIRLLYEKEQK